MAGRARLEDVVLVDDGEVDQALRVQPLQPAHERQQQGQQRQEDLQHQAYAQHLICSHILKNFK